MHVNARDTCSQKYIHTYVFYVLPCGKMTLLSFIFTSLPLRLKLGEERSEGRKREREREKLPKTANLLQRQVIDSGWGINEASARYDSTVSDSEDLCRPLGSGSH